jgi:hypothetical protein
VQTTTPVVGRRVGRRVGACESNESESRRKSVLNSGRSTIRPQSSTPRSKTICMHVCRKQGQSAKRRVYFCTVPRANSSAHSSAQPALAPFRVVMETRHRRAPEDSGIRAGRWSALAGCLSVSLSLCLSVSLSLCLSVSLSLCLSLCLYMQTDRLFVMNGRDSPGYRRLRQRVALHFRGHHRACTWERACQAANVHDVSDRHGWHRNPVFVSTSIRPDVTIQGSPNQYP